MSNAEYAKPSSIYSYTFATATAVGGAALSVTLPPAYFKVGVSRIIGLKWTSDATGLLPVAEPLGAGDYTYTKAVTIAAAQGAAANPILLVQGSGAWTAIAYATILFQNENPQTAIGQVVAV